MAQHDYNIANQGFPAFRTDLNNALSAIQTTHSGTSRPTGPHVLPPNKWAKTTAKGMGCKTPHIFCVIPLKFQKYKLGQIDLFPNQVPQHLKLIRLPI